MKLLQGFSDPDAYAGGYISIGNFDGVHRGHQAMIAALVQQSRDNNAPAVVLTFDPHPITLLAPGRVPPRLSTLKRKAELLQECGVDVLVAYPTDHELLSLTPEQFFDQIVLGELQARGLVEGPNFFFGKDRAGDITRLRALTEAAGLTLTIVEAVKEGEAIASSSAIRTAIREGRLADAVAMLGHPYQITGTVQPGAGRGSSLGFPTANLTDIETMLPPDGVYAGCVPFGGDTFPAAVHLGPNPTFAEAERKLEVHILDFSQDLYQQALSVNILARVRDTMHFPDADSLQSQLKADIATIRDICRHNRR